MNELEKVTLNENNDALDVTLFLENIVADLRVFFESTASRK